MFSLQRTSDAITTVANNASDIKTIINICTVNFFQSKTLNQITQPSQITKNEVQTYYVKHQIDVNVSHKAMPASALGLTITFSIPCFILNLCDMQMHNAIHHHPTHVFQTHGLPATCSLQVHIYSPLNDRIPITACSQPQCQRISYI
jgi:hypothetical protein